MDAWRAVSSWSFVVVVCLILIIGARCGRVVGETALNYSRPTVATYSAPDSYEKLSHSSEGDFSNEAEEEEEEVGEGAPADFVPTKLYAQVRRTHTVERLPRGDALKSATNEEEILAAPRLREVVSKSKTNTVYTEEGYEDAAYDHGGHVRDAEFREGYEKKVGEEEEPNNRQRFENVWGDASINPKDVAENEIERLEEDLKSEYEESERKAENESLTEKPKTAGSEENEEEIDESSAAAMSLPDIESVPRSAEPSAEYGKIFWDYFKSIGRKKNEARNSSLDDESRVVGGSAVNFHSPATKFGDSYAADGRKKDAYPSAASLYESWKRQDRYGNSDESREFEWFGSDRPQSEEELFEDDTLVNLQNFEGSTTLVGPKKLSYTIIVRPSEKAGTSTTTRSCPCDRGVDGTRHGERTPIVKWFPREEASREAVNDFSNANDFTGVRAVPPPPPPSLPAPSQITYADFPPDSYARLAQPSVSREIGRSAGERDPYEPSKNSYANSGQNPRGNRFRSYRKKPRLVFHPRTRLVPPLLANGSKYSQIVGAKAIGKGINKKFDGISGRKSWPEILRFYRSFEKRLFGRGKRSLAVEGKSKEAGARVSGEKKMPPKRNLFGESDRSVEPDNGRAEKPKGNNERRKSSHGDEKLLREAPRIVEQVINGEIQARFSNQEHEPSDDDDDDDDDDDEKGERIEAQVTEFNASKLLEEDESSDGDRVMIKTMAKDAFVDSEKYPFYENSKVGRSSPLKYATNPRKIPHKTPGGTEFYDSRDAYRECEEVRPEVLVPEEDGGEDSSVEREPRLRGLGDSLDCFRGKYLDDDPLDNPLFLESQVGQPRIPEELDPKKVHLRISEDPSSEEDARVVRRISRRPEDKDRGSEPAPYQRHVYEDVTGTIKNLAAMYERLGEAVTPSSRFHRYRLVPYGTKRASYGRRRRKEEKPPGSESVEAGYFGIVSVHKRSVNNEGQSLLESKATTNNETRIVYTIRDRTGGSKPPRNLTRGGRRVTVERKKDSSGVENEEPARVRMVESSRAKNATTSDAKDRYLDEPNEETYKNRYSEIRGKRVEPDNFRDRERDEKSEESLSNSGSVESSEQEPRLLEPREYLQSEPPGYTEASVNESTEASSSEKPNGDEDLRGSERYKNFEESGEEEEEESPERPHRVAKDSKMESERFASRPFSPFESFEDPKYGELGPRLSKPSFHHPSFSSVIASRRIEYSGESGSDESDGAKSRYSFPWDRSHEDQEWREYPWERRERLARERRGRAKERKQHQRLYGFDDDDDDDDDEDASETRSNERFVYPWERYGLPSRIYGRKARISDNEETSSIARPRFSSRYKTKIGRVNGDEKDDEAARTFRVDNGKMKISVTESLEEANATTTLASKKPIRRKIATPSTTDSRISRTSTTKKPLVGKRKNGRGAKELSGQVPKVSRKTRGRATPTTTTTTTGRSPPRPRFRKKNPVESATIGSSVIEKSTTAPPPKVKTLESHTRFSKERIRTNSSYPAWNGSLYGREEDRIGGERPDAEIRKPRIPNETVRRESTMSKETPDRVYRGIIINENGATNTSATVATSKNRPNSLVDTIETSKMLENFEDSEDTPVDEDSFARDSHLLANLLSRVPPSYTNNLTTLREDARGSEAFSEGSGSLPDDYEKHPERRLYFYVQDL